MASFETRINTASRENIPKTPDNRSVLSESVRERDPKRHIFAEYIGRARQVLKKSNTDFSGKDKITVSGDIKKDPTKLSIRSSADTITINLHYDETYELTDSLRKNKAYHPEIELIAKVGDEEYSIQCNTIEDATEISGELLKQIERMKNPKAFGFKEVDFILGPDREIFLAGKKPSGKGYRLEFFEKMNIEDRLTLFSYIAHYFSRKIDPKLLEEPESDDDGFSQKGWPGEPKESNSSI